MLYNSNAIAYNHHTNNYPCIFLHLYINIYIYIHRSAFGRLEAESEVATVELRAQLGVAKSRLQAYEALEEEIDGAVLRVAQAGQITDGGVVKNDLIDKENVGQLAQELAGNF